jgi:5-methylcytosine-specific restriction endonuclease McrA
MHSEETRIKIGDANRRPIYFSCDYCGEQNATKASAYKRKKRHFCNQGCYSFYRKERMLPEEQPTWKGGISNAEAHRRWKKKHPQQMAHLKARRYARERGAEGSHTLEEWTALKDRYDHKCAACQQIKPLTKDHIIPLSAGGTDFIGNIQPLCRNCNSKKWAKTNFNIYENPELLREKEE